MWSKTVVAVALGGLSLLVPGALGFGYSSGGGDATNPVEELLLSMQLKLYDTFPAFPEELPDGRFNASVLPSEENPAPVHSINYYHIKEYADGSTTLDSYVSIIGLLVSIGVTDYATLTPQEIWEQIPATRNASIGISDEFVAYGSTWSPYATHAVYWDAPVTKTDGEDGATLYTVSVNASMDNSNVMYPRTIIDVGDPQAYNEAYDLTLSKSADGVWSHYNTTFHALTTTDPDFVANPAAIIDRFEEYLWWTRFYKAPGDGVFGGLGNPPLDILDLVEPTFI